MVKQHNYTQTAKTLQLFVVWNRPPSAQESFSPRFKTTAAHKPSSSSCFQRRRKAFVQAVSPFDGAHAASARGKSPTLSHQFNDDPDFVFIGNTAGASFRRHGRENELDVENKSEIQPAKLHRRDTFYCTCNDSDEETLWTCGQSYDLKLTSIIKIKQVFFRIYDIFYV